MRSVVRELGRVRHLQIDDVAGKLDGGALHPQADAEERQAAFARVANRFDLAVDPAVAEAARHENAIDAGQQPFGALRARSLRL